VLAQSPVIAAVRALAEDDRDTANDAIDSLIERSSETERQAAAIRLRALGRHHNNLTELTDKLADRLDTAENPASNV
jgi:hypothetical protein